jgi:hypothetical protein
MDTFRKIMIRFLIVGLLLSVILLAVFFESIARFLYTSGNPNGEFLKVILSVLGGIGVIYGLWINSQRIKAQNKQNKLVEDRNQDQKSYDADKRFGEAIGYLGSENTSIVLGGIYSLYQLAKEDKRYKTIVAGLYTSYLQNKSKELYLTLKDKYVTVNKKKTKIPSSKIPIVIRTIVDSIFNNENIFRGIRLNFSDVLFRNIEINANITDCDFTSCTFYNCRFNGNMNNCSFYNCDFKHFNRFGGKDALLENCIFQSASKLNSTHFEGLKFEYLTFEFVTLTDVTFKAKELVNSHIHILLPESKNILFSNIASFKGTEIDLNLEKMEFKNCVDYDDQQQVD